MNTTYLIIPIVLLVAIYMWPRKKYTSKLVPESQESDDDENQIFINP